jgi:ribosome maturation protein Sdo1
MTKRLQVLFDDDELVEIQRLAKARRQTTAAWVRDALRAARQEAIYPDPERKLRAVREALTHAYPTGDIDEVVADIELGYRDEHD